jgi:hypothetical protein
MHLCDATDAQVAELVDTEKPTIFCVFRTVLSVVGIPAETPGAAFQIIVPIMFAIMALRFLAQGIGYGLILAGGSDAVAMAEAEEKRRELAQQADSMGPPPPDGGSAGKGTGQ